MAQGIFENQDVGSISGGVQPQQATAPAPSAISTIASSGVLSSVGDLFSGVVAGFQQGQKEAAQLKQDQIMANYAKRVTALDAAVAQGTKTQAAAQREQRALYNQTIANNPHLTEKLTDFTKSLAGTAGLGDTLAEGTEIDKQRKKDRQSAYTDGYIRPGMTAEQEEAALDVWHKQNASIRAMELQSKQNALVQQQLSMQATRENIAYTRTQRANSALDLQMKRSKQKIQMSVADLASARTQRLDIIGRDLSAKVDSGEISREQAAQMWQGELNKEAVNLSKFRGAAGGDYVDSMAKPMSQIGNSYADYFSGKTTKEVLENGLKIQEAQAAQGFYDNPDNVKQVAMTKLCGNPSLGMSLNMSKDCLDFLTKGQSGSKSGVDVVTNNVGVADYSNTLKESVRDGNTRLQGQQKKERMQDVADQYGSVMRGVAKNAQYADKPSDFNAALDMFASPEFLSVMNSGAIFPEGSADDTQKVLNDLQRGQLFPAINEAWTTSNTVVNQGNASAASSLALGGATGNVVPTEQALRYSWTGTGIEFIPTEKYANDAQARAKAADLNRKVAPLINKNVRANAHLKGTKDYTSVFNEMAPQMFGEAAPAPTESDVTGR